MIKEFEHKQFGKVRVVELDGKPWFVGADFCKVLNINKVHMRRLNDNNKKIYPMPILLGVQKMIIVNAAGLHELMLASDNTAAKSWIKHAVLLDEKISTVALKPAALNYAPNSLAVQKGTLGELKSPKIPSKAVQVSLISWLAATMSNFLQKSKCSRRSLTVWKMPRVIRFRSRALTLTLHTAKVTTKALICMSLIL